MSSTYTDKKNPFWRLYDKHRQLETFSQPYSVGFSQISLPIIVLPKDDRTGSVQEEQLGSSILDHDLGHVCRGRRIQMYGHSDFGNFQ